MADVSISAEDFLQALQIVELTRDYPNLKAVHDAMLKKCEDHAKDLLAKAEEKAKAETKAENHKSADPMRR